MDPRAEVLRKRASRFRQIAATLSDHRTRSAWLSMALDVERDAESLEAHGDWRKRLRLIGPH